MEKKEHNQLLLEYMLTHEIDDKMIWKQDAISNMCFVRDTLCCYLLRVPVFVVSTHRSKSIKLPVYYFEMRNGIRAIMRGDFHDWVISLMTPFPVTLEDFCHGSGGKPYVGDIHPCYAEGFKPSWIYPYVKENARRTTFYVDGNYKLYTLFYLLDRIPPAEKKDPEVVRGSKFARSIMEGLIEKHPAVNAWQLFERPVFKAEDRETGYCYINKYEILEELPKRIDLYDDVAEEFYTEIALLHRGGEFE